MNFAGGALPPDFVLLRGSPLQADISLRPGSAVTGRVIELLGNGRGFITLAGVRVEAQLPGNVRPGDVLRMRVATSPEDQLTLRVVEQLRPSAGQEAAQAAAPAAAAASGAQAQNEPPLAAFGLPGGATAQLRLGPDEEDEGTGPERPPVRTLVLRYDSDLLGRVDVVVRVDDEAVTATVLTLPGKPLETARGASGELRSALLRTVDLPARVLVGGRPPEPVDVRV